MIDHLHLAVTDQAKAVEWYHKYFNAEITPEGTERVMFGTTRMIFQLNKAPKPSEHSVLELIGISVSDVDGTIKRLQSDGVTVVAPVQTVEGLKVAQVVDPWGTLINVVQDPQKLGLHHICLATPDPVASLAWFADKFGGKVEKFKGQDAINYGGVWLIGAQGDSEPSGGHAIDHMGMRPLNVDAAVAALKAKNVKVTTEPRPLTLSGGATMRLAFIEGPSGVRIELVQRDNVKN